MNAWCVHVGSCFRMEPIPRSSGQHRYSSTKDLVVPSSWEEWKIDKRAQPHNLDLRGVEIIEIHEDERFHGTPRHCGRGGSARA